MADGNEFGRRGALGLIGGAAAAVALGAPKAAAAAQFDPAADPLTTYMLMRAALDQRVVIGTLQGTYFGVIDGALTPLFGVVSATFARYRPRAGGGYEVANSEVAYFTDLATGKFIESWTNPYTNETVTIPRQGLPPGTFAILPNMTFKLQRNIPGMQFDHHIEPAQMRGNDIWVPELTVTAVPIPGAPRPMRYSEKTTLHARLSDFKAGAKQVGSDTSFTNIVSWRPWLNMGDRPGHMMAIGTGRYGGSISTLPPALVEALQAKRPEVLADPGSLIDPLWK